jgi:hypothetical protein
VLLGDRGVAALPALAELAQVRQDDLGQHRVDGRHCKKAVEDRLCLRLVERIERAGELRAHRLRRRRGAAGVFARLGPEHEGSRLRGGQAAGQVPAHEADPLQVGRRVQAEAARRARRAQQPVAAFPRAQELRADA